MNDVDRAALLMQGISRMLDVSGLGPEDCVRVLLSQAAVEHRRCVEGGVDLPPLAQMASSVEELTLLALHPTSTSARGKA